MRTLVRPWVGTAVGQHVLAVDIAGLHAAQKGADGAKLLRRAKAPGRNALAPCVGQGLHRLAGLFGIGRQHGLDAVGVKHTGQQVVDRHPLRRQAAARHAGHKACQPAARAIGQAQRLDGRLHRAGGDVDDAPEAALRHAVDRGLDELDGRQHIGVHRLDPGVAVPVAKVPRRRATGVGDHDVKVRRASQRPPPDPPAW